MRRAARPAGAHRHEARSRRGLPSRSRRFHPSHCHCRLRRRSRCRHHRQLRHVPEAHPAPPAAHSAHAPKPEPAAMALRPALPDRSASHEQIGAAERWGASPSTCARAMPAAPTCPPAPGRKWCATGNCRSSRHRSGAPCHDHGATRSKRQRSRSARTWRRGPFRGVFVRREGGGSQGAREEGVKEPRGPGAQGFRRECSALRASQRP